MRVQKSSQRNGAVLIAVLVVLSVVLSITGATILSSLREHNECRTERQLLQIHFLCEAGFLRSIAQLKQDSNYVGEDWTPDLSDDSQSVAHVTTKVTRAEDQSWTIEVTASLEDGPYRHRAQRTKYFSMKSL